MAHIWVGGLTSLLLSLTVTAIVIWTARRVPGFFMDSVDGPQKFHRRPTPRVGGIAIFTAYSLTAILVQPSGGAEDTLSGSLTTSLIACSLIVLSAGLAEDVTKRVGVSVRLGAAMASAVAAGFCVEAVLSRLDVWFLDQLLHWHWAAFALTAFAVAGIANALNIIDGYNGLCGGYALLALTAIGAVAANVGDQQILFGCVLLGAAIAGFLVWNFPFGHIFMGDAGAYFIGFMLAEWSVLLVHRHSDVSPWFPLLVVAYPVWETLFSIYRKRFVRGSSPGQPDGLHLHMLVYKRIVKWRVAHQSPNSVIANAMTSPYLWALAVIPIILSVLFWNNSLALACVAFGFGALYNILYRRVVLFRNPQWMVRIGQAAARPFIDDKESIVETSGS